jgi:hypothetical protein
MTSWINTKHEIENRIKNGMERPEVPAALPLVQIEVVEDVFQHRMTFHAASEKHIDTLAKAIKNNDGKPLPPLKIFWIGDAWALIDGHHRYQAYKRSCYDQRVPVEVFNGSLDEAIGEALRGNSKDKLPMSSREKSDGAWRLVVGTSISQSAIARIASVSRQTVHTMHKTKQEIIQKHPDVDLADLDWHHARNLANGKDDFAPDPDWLQKMIDEKAVVMRRVFGGVFDDRHEVLHDVLMKCFPKAMENILEDYGVDPETLEVREMEPEDF